jgi:flagellar hook-associated protein 1 FlgK
VLSRDGRHLLGSALNETQQGLLLKTANGMEAGATYSAQALNASLPETYLGMDIFMGAKASVSLVQQFNATTGEAQAPLKLPASLTGQVFANSSAGLAAGVEGVGLARTMAAYGSPMAKRARKVADASVRLAKPIKNGPSMPVLLDAAASLHNAKRKREEEQKKKGVK